MQAKMKFSKRVASLATALVTGLSAAGVTSIPVEGFVTLSASADGHEYVNGFCTEESCDAPYEQPEADDNGVYQIANAGQLYWFAEQANVRVGFKNPNSDINAVLTADIIVNEGNLANYDGTSENTWREWTPIAADFGRYKGTFDGQGHTISGLYLNDSSIECIGIVGELYTGGVIQNVGLENSYFHGEQNIAGICGYSSGTISNCYSAGTVIGELINIGGIVGSNYGTVSNCYNTGSIDGVQNTGGICGFNESRKTIENCYNTGNITGELELGGICGANSANAIIKNCYNTGDVTGTDEEIGGVIGENSSRLVENCYNTGTVTSTGEDTDTVGAVCGWDKYEDVKNCYYLAESETDDLDGTTFKTADQFTSGEVCYLLNKNSGSETSIFYQTIGEDDYPVLDSIHQVVYAETNCSGSVLGYTNDQSVLKSDHDWDNGFCNNNPAHYQEPEQIDGVYQIANAGQLYWFAAYVNTYDSDGEVKYPNVAANAVLTADITVNEGDLANYDGTSENTWREWTPIASDAAKYAGKFDGQGHTISGLYFNNEEENYVGIFGQLYNGGEVQNVGLKNSYFRGKNYIGGISGANTISTIRNCYSEANVTGVADSSSGVDIGGVVGQNNGTVENCYNTGNVIGNKWVGGVCGYNGGTSNNCYNTGEVTGTTDVGSVCGQNDGGTLTNCYYLADSETNNDDGTFGKTAEQFASGAVAYLLNGSTSDDVAFYQNLDNGEPTDAIPVLDSTHGTVHQFTNCLDTTAYTNDGTVKDTDHIWDDNGFCRYSDSHYAEPEQVDGVYQIANAGQLYWFAAEVNDGNDELNAVLTADITVNEGDLTNYDGTSANTWRTWTPITTYYRGTFNGQGHAIRGLYFNDDSVGDVSLFISLKGKVQNVGLENAYFMGRISVSGICVNNDGTIENCYNTGTFVAKKGYVSGLAVNNYGEIVNSYNIASVIADADIAGGIAAVSFGTIKNCYNVGTLTGSKTDSLVKENNGNFENCYYLADSESDNGNGTFGKTADQFASGEVAYLLNGDQSNIAFYQDLSAEAYPTLNADSKQVCRLELTYDESFGEDAATETTYHNADDAIELEASPDKAYMYQYTAGETQITESPYTLTGDTAIIVKKVPVEIELSEEFDAVFLLTYQKAFGSLDLTEFVTNFDVLKSINFQVDADSALPEGLTLTVDGVLSGTPEKAADAVKTTLILTAGNGASRNATLTFRIAKADPTVEVTVDGESHTEGDLVSELGLRLSENSTKGTVKIISEIKALVAGKNTLMWEFTPEDSDNYYTATGTVIVNAQTTTTKETTSTTKESTTTSKTTATTKASASASKTTATTKASASASGTTATTKASASASKTTATTKASASASGTTATTKASASASGTTATTKASASASGTTATTKASTTTSKTTATTKASASTGGTTATTKASASASRTTATTKASASASGTTVTTKASASASGTTATTKASASGSETTATTKASASASGTTVTTKASASTSNVGSTSETNSTVTGTASSVTETTTESTMQTTQTTLTTESVTTATSLTTASSATSKTNIADESLCDWAINDYQKKTGVTPANAEITARSEDAYEITLTDENGEVLDIYTVDPKTGVGTDSSNAEVNLPQTGNNAMTNWIVFFGAVLFLGFGFGAVKASGVLKRKEEE